MKKEVLRIESVRIEKDHIIYLDDLSLCIAEGEILGMILRNHHGLNQLIGLIMKNVPLKYGRVYFNGVLVNDNIRAGKGNNRACIIDNRIRLVSGLTVADNIFVLRKEYKNMVINNKVIEELVQEVFHKLSISIRPDALAESLSAYERCVIELIKAIISGIKFIIIYDIVSVINYTDLKKFNDLILYYTNQGITFLYIGNHYEDVFQICTRAVMFGDGKIFKIFYPEDMDEAHVAPFVDQIKETAVPRVNTGECISKIHQLSLDKLHDFSCEIFSGKCLAILDKDHSVLYSIMDIIIGKSDVKAGNIYFEGKLRKKGSWDIKRDIMIIPEDPIKNYLFLDQSYLYNLCFQIDQKIKKKLFR